MDAYMGMNQQKSGPSVFSILITGIIVIIGIAILYGIYTFLYGSSSTQMTKIITSQVTANVAHTNLPKISGLYEGGDYAVSTWIYINSYNINRNTRKHVLEIGGKNFSTLLIALGAFKNTLLVRTHSRDSETVVVGSSTSTGSASTVTPTTPSTTTTTTTASPASNPTNSSMPPGAKYSFYDASGVLHYYDSSGNQVNASGTIIKNVTYDANGNMLDSNGNIIQTTPTNLNPDAYVKNTGPFDTTAVYDQLAAGRYPTSTNTPLFEGFANATPGSNDATIQDGSLTAANLDTMFKPLAMDDSLLNPTQMCDIPQIDMQRWVNVTVILSGNIVDVYMDGKLGRSCVLPSYFKVDPTGVTLKVTERGGFDGYLNGLSVFNYPLSPADVYRIYQSGPTGTSASVGSMMSSLFTGGK